MDALRHNERATMARKLTKPARPKSEKFPRKSIPVRGGRTDEEDGRNYAVLMASPELAAYRVINSAKHKSGLAESIDVPTMLSYLREQAAAVNRGDLAQSEGMLMNQATVYNSRLNTP